MKKKINCWEYMQCGRGPRGERVAELGLCLAASHTSAHGTNGGKNGGRICWAIAGIYALDSEELPQSRKHYLCYDCEFHRKVLSEEGIIKPKILVRQK